MVCSHSAKPTSESGKESRFRSGSTGQADGVTIVPVVYPIQAATAAKELFMPGLSSCHLTGS